MIFYFETTKCAKHAKDDMFSHFRVFRVFCSSLLNVNMRERFSKVIQPLPLSPYGLKFPWPSRSFQSLSFRYRFYPQGQ